MISLFKKIILPILRQALPVGRRLPKRMRGRSMYIATIPRSQVVEKGPATGPTYRCYMLYATGPTYLCLPTTMALSTSNLEMGFFRELGTPEEEEDCQEKEKIRRPLRHIFCWSLICLELIHKRNA